MKRGSTDVDWVIAIGLFIIFLLSIFVFFKPGIIPPHRPEALLDIVENNIKNETQVGGPGIYWTLYELPLYLEKDASVSGSSCFKIRFDYGWSEDSFDIYKITGDDTNSNDPVDPTKQTPISFKTEGNYIIFKPGLSSTNKEVFIIDYSDNNILSKRTIKSDHNVDCGEPTPIIIEEKDPLDPSKINFKYSYGVTESIRGISIDMFKWGVNQGSNFYNGLKPKMGFPQLKEFSVHIKNTEEQTATCDVLNPTSIRCDFQPVQPEIDANIFVREWSDYVLNYNGLRDPVIVNIRTW